LIARYFLTEKVHQVLFLEHVSALGPETTTLKPEIAVLAYLHNVVPLEHIGCCYKKWMSSVLVKKVACAQQAYARRNLCQHVLNLDAFIDEVRLEIADARANHEPLLGFWPESQGADLKDWLFQPLNGDRLKNARKCYGKISRKSSYIKHPVDFQLWAIPLDASLRLFADDSNVAGGHRFERFWQWQLKELNKLRPSDSPPVTPGLQYLCWAVEGIYSRYNNFPLGKNNGLNQGKMARTFRAWLLAKETRAHGQIKLIIESSLTTAKKPSTMTTLLQQVQRTPPERCPDIITISVLINGSESFDLHIDPITSQVADVKKEIRRLLRISPGPVIFHGKLLHETHTLASYGIENGDCLHISPALAGNGRCNDHWLVCGLYTEADGSVHSATGSLTPPPQLLSAPSFVSNSNGGAGASPSVISSLAAHHSCSGLHLITQPGGKESQSLASAPQAQAVTVDSHISTVQGARSEPIGRSRATASSHASSVPFDFNSDSDDSDEESKDESFANINAQYVLQRSGIVAVARGLQVRSLCICPTVQRPLPIRAKQFKPFDIVGTPSEHRAPLSSSPPPSPPLPPPSLAGDGRRQVSSGSGAQVVIGHSKLQKLCARLPPSLVLGTGLFDALRDIFDHNQPMNTRAAKIRLESLQNGSFSVHTGHSIAASCMGPISLVDTIVDTDQNTVADRVQDYIRACKRRDQAPYFAFTINTGQAPDQCWGFLYMSQSRNDLVYAATRTTSDCKLYLEDVQCPTLDYAKSQLLEFLTPGLRMQPFAIKHPIEGHEDVKLYRCTSVLERVKLQLELHKYQGHLNLSFEELKTLDGQERLYGPPHASDWQKEMESEEIFPNGLHNDERVVGVAGAFDKKSLKRYNPMHDIEPLYMFLEGLPLELRNQAEIGIPMAFIPVVQRPKTVSVLQWQPLHEEMNQAHFEILTTLTYTLPTLLTADATNANC
tara:strand:+ start:367 stop:3210 length:2844 start_codon:yes stop_codon:yes gene_type:complete